MKPRWGAARRSPRSPVDGDIHVYPADTTNGVMWMFMYRSAVNDWEFIGGSALWDEVVDLANNELGGHMGTWQPQGLR